MTDKYYLCYIVNHPHKIINSHYKLDIYLLKLNLKKRP